MRMLTLFAVAMIAASCSYGNATGPACSEPCPNPVRVMNNRFEPPTRSVQIDETVTWFWNSNGVSHNVTFNDGPSSGNRSSGQYGRTFTLPGVYSYQCTLHGSSMSGTITVN
jgi:plastocyanin